MKFRELSREEYLQLSNDDRKKYHEAKDAEISRLYTNKITRTKKRDYKRFKSDILKITNEIDRNAHRHHNVELAAAKLVYFGLPPEVVIEQLYEILNDEKTANYDKIRILGYFKDTHDADKQIQSRKLAESGGELTGGDKGLEVSQEIHELVMREIQDES